MGTQWQALSMAGRGVWFDTLQKQSVALFKRKPGRETENLNKLNCRWEIRLGNLINNNHLFFLSYSDFSSFFFFFFKLSASSAAIYILSSIN